MDAPTVPTATTDNVAEMPSTSFDSIVHLDGCIYYHWKTERKEQSRMNEEEVKTKIKAHLGKKRSGVKGRLKEVLDKYGTQPSEEVLNKYLSPSGVGGKYMKLALEKYNRYETIARTQCRCPGSGNEPKPTPTNE